MRNLVQEFKNKILAHYPDLHIGVDYDAELDDYDIWHNNAKLEFEDEEFKKIVGKIVQEVFFDKGVYNFVFGYDYFKAKILGKSYTTVSAQVDKMEICFSQMEHNINYTKVFKKPTTNQLFISINMEYNPEHLLHPLLYYFCQATPHIQPYNIFNTDMKEVA